MRIIHDFQSVLSFSRGKDLEFHEVEAGVGAVEIKGDADIARVEGREGVIIAFGGGGGCVIAHIGDLCP